MTHPVTSPPSVSTIGELLTVVVVPVDATRATVQLDGDLDLLCAAGVTQVLDDQLLAGRRFVTADVSRLTFVNSAGLRLLASAHNRFLTAGGRLVLVGVTPRMAQLLAITHLDEALNVSDGSDARHLVSVDTGASRRR